MSAGGSRREDAAGGVRRRMPPPPPPRLLAAPHLTCARPPTRSRPRPPQNWGLLLFDERRILFSEGWEGAYGAAQAVNVLCHEVAHQWCVRAPLMRLEPRLVCLCASARSRPRRLPAPSRPLPPAAPCLTLHLASRVLPSAPSSPRVAGPCRVGNLVSPEDWTQVSTSEGMATYLEYLCMDVSASACSAARLRRLAPAASSPDGVLAVPASKDVSWPEMHGVAALTLCRRLVASGD